MRLDSGRLKEEVEWFARELCGVNMQNPKKRGTSWELGIEDGDFVLHVWVIGEKDRKLHYGKKKISERSAFPKK